MPQSFCLGASTTPEAHDAPPNLLMKDQIKQRMVAAQTAEVSNAVPGVREALWKEQWAGTSASSHHWLKRE